MCGGHPDRTPCLACGGQGYLRGEEAIEWYRWTGTVLPPLRVTAPRHHFGYPAGVASRPVWETRPARPKGTPTPLHTPTGAAARAA